MSTNNTLSTRALYKCWVVWEGNIKKTFYSYDSSGRYTVENPDEYGLKGLQKRVVKQYPERMKKAIIYDNQTGLPLYELRIKSLEWVEVANG